MPPPHTPDSPDPSESDRNRYVFFLPPPIKLSTPTLQMDLAACSRQEAGGLGRVCICDAVVGQSPVCRLVEEAEKWRCATAPPGATCADYRVAGLVPGATPALPIACCMVTDSGFTL